MITEGSTIFDIARTLGGDFSKFNENEFLEIAKDKEGYLFPDTYTFLPNLKAKDVVNFMEDNFYRKTSEVVESIEGGKELDDIIIMASLLEKEARTTETRRIISGILWKRIEHSDGDYFSSLFNSKILIFYTMALVFVGLDYVWQTHSFMFFSQVILFLFASIISYTNYSEKGRQHKFLKFYFIAMLLSFGAWVLNAIAALYFSWNQEIVVSSYVLNSIIFLLFLWGVNKVTR